MSESAPVRMSIQSSPAHLPVVRGAVEQMCRVLGFDELDSGRAAAAVDEALANVIEHAYGSRPDEPIEVVLVPLGDDRGCVGLGVELCDRGRVVDAEGICGRDLQDIRPGGLGTHIMGCCMDVVEYTHPPAGGTRLRMVKYLPGRGGGEDDGAAEKTAGVWFDR